MLKIELEGHYCIDHHESDKVNQKKSLDSNSMLKILGNNNRKVSTLVNDK